MTGRQETNISFLTSDDERTLIATATDTNGKPISSYALTTQINQSEELPLAQNLIRYIFTMIQEMKIQLKPEMGVAYGFWLIKLIETEKNHLEIFELNEQNRFIPGSERAIKYFTAQNRLCDLHQFPFSPVNVQQTAIVNRKVFQSSLQTLIGFRNVRREDMSGWVIITNEDDLWDTENTENMYLYDIILKRPELIHFFGLPMDSAFYLNDEGYRVWSLEEE